MLFTTPVFLFLFLPLVLLIYYALRPVYRNTFLFVASLFFYAWGETFFVLLMLISIVFNYLFGLLIHRAVDTGRAKVFLVLAVVFNLSLLGFFKYANFIVDNMNTALPFLALAPISLQSIHLPLGISFFTFQAMSYVIDVYRRDAPVVKNIMNVALYIALFPQLIAGPIVRYHDVAKQIIRRRVNSQSFVYGIQRFVIGLAKKMVIANPMGAVADQIFAIPANELSMGLCWLGAICYAIQIYFDFSAYSDMAIGLGRMFGFRFLENFNYPYVARSVQEFWRRWHISLSSWFRDYLYFPLGGNRRGARRTYFNLFTVFFLCGLWHGASWSFVVWGMIHGGFLVIERVGFSHLLRRLWSPLQHFYTLLVVLIGWVFFRSDTLSYAVEYLQAMVGMGQATTKLHYVALYLTDEVKLILLAGVLFSSPLFRTFSKRANQFLVRNDAAHLLVNAVFLSVMFLVSASLIAAGTYNPFIYFRF